MNIVEFCGSPDVDVYFIYFFNHIISKGHCRSEKWIKGVCLKDFN